MKKDYVAVPASEAQEEETRYIAASWTQRWRGVRDRPDVSTVARREEYRLMRPYLERLPRGSRLLDGGCGLGEWTIFLLEKGYDVVGIDISVETVEPLAASYPGRFLCRDVRETGLPDGSFDAYFSWGTFEHFELGMEACVREAYRILRPGGLLFTSVPFQNWRHIFRDAGRLDAWDETYDREFGYREAHRFYQWRFTKPELQRELELRGFRVLRIAPIGREHGVHRWLQWDARALGRNRWVAAIARRVFALLLPAPYIAHMLWAVALRDRQHA